MPDFREIRTSIRVLVFSDDDNNKLHGTSNNSKFSLYCFYEHRNCVELYFLKKDSFENSPKCFFDENTIK
jgi:hypothetical protein